MIVSRIDMWKIMALVVVGIMASSVPCLADEQEKVMVFGGPEHVILDHALKGVELLSEAFERLGYGFEVRELPFKRTIAFMASGELDGDLARVYDFNMNGSHPEYVRVEEPLFTVKAVAYAMDPEISISNLDDLREGQYRVGYLEGLKWNEQNLVGFLDVENLFPQPISTLQGLQLLVEGRIDVFVYASQAHAEAELESSGLATEGIFLAGILDENWLYPYLHKNHQALAEPLAEAIREVKAEQAGNK